MSFSECVLSRRKTFTLSEQSIDEINTLAQMTQKELEYIQNQIQEETTLINSQMWESTFETIEFDKLPERRNDLLKQEAVLKFSFYHAINKILSNSNMDVQELNRICR